MLSEKIILPGGAGLVGQNLILRLKDKGYDNILVIDKHRTNLRVLADLHPDVQVELADLSVPGAWQDYFLDADIVILLQSQIGGNRLVEFERNNIDSTRLILQSINPDRRPYIVHVSSSVVESVVDDFYSTTKTAQENLVLASGLQCPVLRPTLMYGWFDRKHLGWLSRLMTRLPVFPIPGRGHYMRQPLYVGDFCNIIISCMENRVDGGIYNISGQQKVAYIDIIREVKKATRSRAVILPIPYRLFHVLLRIWGLFDRDPPFTTQQLAALRADDEFEVIDWPLIFGVPFTPFDSAINETFNHSRYSKIVLDF